MTQRKPTLYTGPAKPIPLRINTDIDEYELHPLDNRFTRVLFLLCLIAILLLDLFYWRPN